MRLTIFKSANQEDLIDRCVKNERKAQKEVYDKFAGKMLAVCKRYIADPDLAEDQMIGSFMKVFEKIGTFKKEGSFEGWIRRIMVNDCLTYLRKNKGMYLEVELDQVNSTFNVESLDGILEAEDLMDMINELPTGYKMVFNMYAIEGFSHQEIADKLDISVGTSKSQLNRARKFLQNKLAETEAQELKTPSHGQ